MDKIVTIQYTNSLEELEKQKDEYNKLTYREKKFSDMEQEKLTGLYNNDVYNLIKANILSKDKEEEVQLDNPDSAITEGLDLHNMYNKSKYNANKIDREIKLCNKILEKNKDNIKVQNKLEYLKCIKEINKNDNTTLDRVYLLQVNAICKAKISNKEKKKYIDIIIKDMKKVIMNYDIAISYMYKEDKVEDGIKKATEFVFSNILGTVVGPVYNVVSYCIKRNNSKLMIKLRSSTKPKEDVVKEKDKLENTLKVIQLKKNQLNKEE